MSPHPHFTIPTLPQLSVSILSNHSASHTNCHVFYRIISCIPPALSISPDNLALSAHTLRSNCVSYYYLILSAPIHIPSQSNCVLPYLLLYQSPYLFISNIRFGRLSTYSAHSRSLGRSTIDRTCSLSKLDLLNHNSSMYFNNASKYALSVQSHF